MTLATTSLEASNPPHPRASEGKAPAEDPARDALPDIERAFSSIIRWGNLPRVRERFVAAAGMDLDRSSYSMLSRLTEGAPMRLSDLAQRSGVDLSTASRQVHHLQVAGLVVRVTMEEDRRAALLSVTPAGQEMVQRLHSAKRGVFTEMLAGWSSEELAELGRVLTRLAGDMVAFGCQNH